MKPILTLCLLLLAACDGGPETNSGVTAEEAVALNEAERMLDEPAETGDVLVSGNAQ